MAIWVQQKETNGCVAAALAMVMETTYEEAAAMFTWPRAEDGRYCMSELYVIGERVLGWKWVHTSARQRAKQGIIAPAPVNIATVKVFESSPLYHAVVVLDDGTVLDPLDDRPRCLDEYFWVGGISGIIK